MRAINVEQVYVALERVLARRDGPDSSFMP
jgi:hypothetical protein